MKCWRTEEPGPGRTKTRMLQIDESIIMQAAVTRHAGAAAARWCEVMTSLVQQLHGFVRDWSLTENEWRAATGFLAAVGRAGELGVECLHTLDHYFGLNKAL